MTAISLVETSIPWSGGVVVAVDQSSAVDRLPGNRGQDPFERLATAFLVGYGRNSAKGYAADLRAWWAWCVSCGVHPFDARRHHVDAWVRTMETPAGSSAAPEHDGLAEPPKPPMKPASIRRRLSAVSKLYKYGIECEVLTYSPVEHVHRPKATKETQSIALATGEITALLDAADRRGKLHGALLTLLVYNGLRIDEALGADVADYTYDRGHRLLRITRKGGKRTSAPLAPPAVRALDDYLATRPEQRAGALFLNWDMTHRLPYRTAYDMVSQVARDALLPAADQVTPHTMRHTFITESLAAGVPLQDVQDAAGHQDPDTTRRYDRNRLTHDRHPTYAFAAHLARSAQSAAPDSGT